MKTVMKSCFVLLGTSLASAHTHAHHHAHHHERVAPLLTVSVTEPPTTVRVNGSEPAITVRENTTESTTTTSPRRPSPVMHQMMQKSEQQQIEEVTDVFYRMFYSGHIQSYNVSPLKSTEEVSAPIKYNYNKYDKESCVNCNEEKRYRDYDYHYKPAVALTCYAMQRSDEGYDTYSFQDISTAGTDITDLVVDGAVTISLSTSFPFYDRYLSNPDAQVFVDGFVSFSVIDPTTLGANTLPNPSEGPYDFIAPYYQSQDIDSTGALVAPKIYYVSDEDETIIQWETNEGTSGDYSKTSHGASIYQVRISSSGTLAFAYKLATCEIPEFTTVQVGVKPLETELQDGYKTSFFQSACQDGGYFAPCPGMSVLLKRVKCTSLISQTGIKKPKVYKNKKVYVNKAQATSSQEYLPKKQHYVDYFHDKSSKLFD